jgi:hypothetical protein
MRLLKDKKTIDVIAKQRDGVFAKFPLGFTLLGTFGVITTYYGFQNILNKFPIFARDPILTLCIGVLILILTGTIYKRLG